MLDKRVRILKKIRGTGNQIIYWKRESKSWKIEGAEKLRNVLEEE